MVRIIYLNLFPLMYWHDGYHRLAYAEDLVQSLWLPLYQSGISLLSPFTRDPGNFRMMTALQAAWAAGAGAWLFRRLGGPWAGWLAGCFLAFCPLFIFESLGLFQEPLFTALLLTSACGLVRGTRGGIWLGLVFLALACLTRYEAWLAAALVLAWVWLGMPGAGYRPVRIFAFRIAASVLILLVPLAWIGYWRGLSPLGLSSLSLGFGWERIGQGLAIWGRHQLQWAGLPLMGLAAYGLFDFLRDALGALRGGNGGPGLPRRWSAWILSGKEKIINGWIGVFLLYAGMVFAMLAIARPFHPVDNVRGAHVAILVEMALGIRGWLLCHMALARYIQGKRLPLQGRAGWRRRWEIGLLWVLALVAFIPSPRYMLRSLHHATNHPMARLSEEVHTMREALHAPVQGVLVLAEGFPSWPDAEPSACIAVTVGLRRSHETVYCDAGVPQEASESWGSLKHWLLSESITHVLKVGGWEAWRPVHQLLDGALSGSEAPRPSYSAESFDLYELSALPP